MIKELVRLMKYSECQCEKDINHSLRSSCTLAYCYCRILPEQAEVDMHMLYVRK